MQDVLTHTADGVMTLTLNRVEKKNSFTQINIARLDTNLSADPKKPRDHIIRLEQALAIHLEHKLLERFRVLLVRQNGMMLNPVVQQLIAFLFEPSRVVKVLRLLHPAIHHAQRRGVNPIRRIGDRIF